MWPTSACPCDVISRVTSMWAWLLKNQDNLLNYFLHCEAREDEVNNASTTGQVERLWGWYNGFESRLKLILGEREIWISLIWPRSGLFTIPSLFFSCSHLFAPSPRSKRLKQASRNQWNPRTKQTSSEFFWPVTLTNDWLTDKMFLN